MTKKLSGITLLIVFVLATINWSAWAQPARVLALSGGTPLPLTCLGTPTPTLCVNGYVYYDGVPVAGASVMIESPYGSLTTTTATGDLSSAPYYQAKLSGSPLLASAGDSITVMATYNGETAKSVYTVAEAGQQVDVVIVRSFDDWWDSAYAYRRPLPISTGSTLAAGTLIKVDGLDFEPLVGQGKLRADHNDLRIVRHISANNWQEVARFYYTGWDVEFKLVTTLNAGTDTSYYIYYGNPTAGAASTFSSPQGWFVDMYHDKWWSEYAGTWSFDQAMDFNNNCDAPVDHDGRIGSSFDESDKYRGRLYVPYTGSWTFRVYTSDGYGVSIDGSQVGRFDGYDTNKWSTVGTMNLKAGWHRMELLDMWVNCGAWKFAMEGPSFPNQIIPALYFQSVWDGIVTGITPSSEEPRTFTAPPVVTFNDIKPNAVVKQSENLILKASATDNDEQGASIAQYVWSSDVNGVLGTTAVLNLSASSLTPGTHVISIKVKDNEGIWSEEINRTIVVEQGSLPTSSPTATPTLTGTPLQITPATDTPTSTGLPIEITPVTSITPSTPTPTATSTPTPTTPDPVTKKKWTMLLYLAGDTGRIDGGSVFGELKKAVRRLESNPNPDVNVVALLDGPDDLDSFRVTFNPQAKYTPLGEVPMDNPQTLVDFVQQAQRDFPAEHYYLVIADHANGVQGIAWDTTTAANKTALLTPAKLEKAFQQLSQDGAAPLDVVHFDGCSFGLLENLATLHNYVRYVVMSENIGWSVFGYDQYRAALTPTISPSEFAQAVAKLYGQTVNAKQLPYTISALDLGQLTPAMTALNGLADALISYIGNDATRRATITSVRTNSQKFDSARPLLEITNDDWYVDLVDFAHKLQSQVNDPALNAAANTLVTTLKTGATPLVLYESHLTASIDQGSTDNCTPGHTWNLNNANGVSIYFPPRMGGTEYTRYTSGDTFAYFANQSHWDEFLQGNVPPLAPGDPAPDDVPIPLAPCSVTEQSALPQYSIYLPVVKR